MQLEEYDALGTTLGTFENRAEWWSIRVVFLLACAHFTLSYVGSHGSVFSLTDYAEGKVGAPFQYRILCAYIMRWLMHLPHWGEIADRSRFFTGSPDKLAVAVIIFPCIVGAVWIAYRTGARLIDERGGTIAAALLLYMAYFAVGLNYTLAYLEPYDVPSLFFFAVAVYALVAEQVWLFSIAFLVGTVNRETTILLLPFLLAMRGRRSLWVAVVLLMSWWGELHLIHQHFDAAHGSFALHLGYNLREIVKPQMWPAIASVFGFLWPIFFFRFRDIEHRRLAHGTMAVLALWLAGMLLVANLNEVRVFTEPIALMAPCIAFCLKGIR